MIISIINSTMDIINFILFNSKNLIFQHYAYSVLTDLPKTNLIKK